MRARETALHKAVIRVALLITAMQKINIQYIIWTWPSTTAAGGRIQEGLTCGAFLNRLHIFFQQHADANFF